MPANQDSYLNKTTLRRLAQMKAADRNKAIKEAGMSLRGASKELKKAAKTGEKGSGAAGRVARKVDRELDRRRSRRTGR